MQLNPNAYIKTLEALRHQLSEKTVEKCSQLAVASHVPLLAVLLYTIKEYGSTPELEKSKDFIVNFYHYDRIEPWN